MTNKEFYREFGNIDPKMIEAAAPAEKVQKNKKNTWVKWVSIAACFCLMVTAGFAGLPYLVNRGFNNSAEAFIISSYNDESIEPQASLIVTVDVSKYINKTNKDGSQTIVDNINLDASNKTIPGKYILTRTYVGGTHNLNATTNEYEFVGTGGSYYQVMDEFGKPVLDDQGNFVYENLFTKDVLVRNYTVYVDRNGIIR